ncbi:hypothetical protein J5X84_39390 [Streptosporangiaceae bacterium NEAU-GS5]|nr:hypothetical protein [Streptosporangiaceae bacterium NEAU-GS5]
MRTNSSHEQVIPCLSALLTRALPLMRLVESEDFTPDERRDLRTRVGGRDFFELSTLLNRVRGEHEPSCPVVIDPTSGAGAVREEITSAERTISHEQVIRRLASSLKRAVPLARRVASGEFTHQERQELRELCGERVFSELCVLLNCLCSEYALRLGRTGDVPPMPSASTMRWLADIFDNTTDR